MLIKLCFRNKKQITNPDDVYNIMKPILLRDSLIDRDKEHFWVIGLNTACYILYIELVSLGGVRCTIVEPINVFRTAVIKNATRLICIHNHPSGSMIPSTADIVLTDRLIQTGQVMNIAIEDHLIISPSEYVSFKVLGLMEELERSINCIPPYRLVKKTRKEEKAIAKDAIKSIKEEKEKILFSAINFLLAKQISVKQMATILNVQPKVVSRVVKKIHLNVQTQEVSLMTKKIT